MQVGLQGLVNQPMNLAQQIGGQQAMANVMFPEDRVPRDTWKLISRYQKFKPYIDRTSMPIGPIR